jgi:hypothetical protein
VGVPLYLHLLRRHKTTPLPFSSLMFFEQRTQSSIKHRRLRYLLLQEAARVASKLGAGDKLQVLAFGSQVHVMGDSAAAIQLIEPTDTRSSYAELSRALRSIAQSARMPVEAHLFSDMQKSSLPANFADLRLGDSVRLIAHPVADGRAANFAVESVNAARRVYGSGKTRVEATIAGYGTEQAKRRVSLTC